MEEWKDGRMEEWKNGRMEEWKDGRMEEWNFGAHLDGPTLAWEDVPTDKTITVFDPPNGRVASLPSGFSAHLD